MKHFTHSIASVFTCSVVLKLRNFKSWYIKNVLRLWRCKFLFQKNAYPAKLLGFVSWIVMLGFLKQKKHKLYALWYSENTKPLLKQQKLTAHTHTYLSQPTGSHYWHFLPGWRDEKNNKCRKSRQLPLTSCIFSSDCNSSSFGVKAKLQEFIKCGKGS